MTPEDRVTDCLLVDLEIKAGLERPWYTSSARLQEQCRNYIASNFMRAVWRCRHVIKADPEIIREELGAELSRWNHQGSVH